MIVYDLTVADRYQLTASIQQTPKKFGGPKGHNWGLRDRKSAINIVLPGMNGTWVTLRECKRRAMLAYIMWFVIKLLENEDDSRKILERREKDTYHV